MPTPFFGLPLSKRFTPEYIMTVVMVGNHDLIPVSNNNIVY